MKKFSSQIAALTGACVLISALAAGPALAEHFDIQLRVNGAQRQTQASMDTTPPIGGLNPRPLLKIKLGNIIKVDWRVRNSSPHGTLKGVTVHLFVVKQEKTGQKPVPDPAGSAGIFDNSFTTNLVLGATANGAMKLTLTEPGSYLVRLQSEGTHDDAGHEHFAAIDVEVQ